MNNSIAGVTCACGCGAPITSLDERGQPRRFIHGHAARVPTTKQLAQRAKLGREILNPNPWNRGRSYVHARITAYANKGAWSKALFRCFPNRCMRCGWDGATCDTHHILARSDGGTFSLDNGVILCPNCHRLVHAGKVTAEELLSIRAAVSSRVEAR